MRKTLLRSDTTGMADLLRLKSEENQLTQNSENAINSRILYKEADVLLFRDITFSQFPLLASSIEKKSDGVKNDEKTQ